MNRGADLLSRGNPLYEEWRLHPQVVQMICQRFGRAAKDFFAVPCEDCCPLFFSLAGDDAPLGIDALAHKWPDTLVRVPLVNPTA